MGPDELVARYLAVAADLDRLRPGVLAAGPAARTAQPSRPAAVVAAAGRLRDDLPAGLPADRVAFLAGQLQAVEWAARRLAGQGVPYATEVAAATGLSIAPGDPVDYRAAHRQMERLLPGRGPLGARWAAYRRSGTVSPERLPGIVGALATALRERTAAVVGLPPGESVRWRFVPDAPWGARHRYRGDGHSEITVNAGAPWRPATLAVLVAHEAYPGHHTERVRFCAGPAADRAEHHVVLIGTPQSTVAEGAAELGLPVVVGSGWGRWVADVLERPVADGELAELVHDAAQPLARVRQDAALLLHADRAPERAVRAHLQRYLLLDGRRTDAVLRFLRHPLWRTQTAAAVSGAGLLRTWWARDEDPRRYRALLDHPWTPAALAADRPTPAEHDDGRWSPRDER